LFPRIENTEKNKEKDKVSAKNPIKEEKIKMDNDNVKLESDIKPQIKYDDFAKLDLRVARVIAAKKVEKADKLLELRVDLGQEQRTIVAGVAQHYQPEDLLGKKIVILANLEPTKIRGIVSEGMLLAASDDQALEVLVLDKEVSPGGKVK